MKRLLLPIILALLGTGAGVAAAVFLAPEQKEPTEAMEEPKEASVEKGSEEKSDEKADAGEDKAKDAEYADAESGFVKLNNQFVIPIMDAERVRSVVVVSLGVEVPATLTEDVYSKEPKLRDAFLQVFFDHANIGGFDGQFTTSPRMESLRSALITVGQKIMGADLRDVLIVEIARQDN